MKDLFKVMDICAMKIDIIDTSGNIIEEHAEHRNGQFQFWDDNTIKRVEERLKKLNR